MTEPAPFCAGISIAEALDGRRVALPPSETRILLGHVLKLTRVQMITQSERRLNPEEAVRMTALCRRRLAGEPIAYLIGEREFYGLALHVDSSVLIPRPETELLVELALRHLPSGGSVLDMGTGSGAIAVAVAHARPDAAVTALDLSDAALRTAQRNAARHGARVSFLRSDWFDALAGKRFDLIVSNPPYIAAGDRHLSEGDLRFEPPNALTDHADGLQALRLLAREAPHHLESGGRLLMEHGYDQAERVRALLDVAGFDAVESWRDLAGIERVTGGRFIHAAPV